MIVGTLTGLVLRSTSSWTKNNVAQILFLAKFAIVNADFQLNYFSWYWLPSSKIAQKLVDADCDPPPFHTPTIKCMNLLNCMKKFILYIIAFVWLIEWVLYDCLFAVVLYLHTRQCCILSCVENMRQLWLPKRSKWKNRYPYRNLSQTSYQLLVFSKWIFIG